MNEGGKKAYRRNKDALNYIINHREMTMVNRDTLKRAFEIMTLDMGLIAVDTPVTDTSPERKSAVKEALNHIMNAVINQPLVPILKDLALEFGLLAFNWNKVVGKRPDITQIIVNTRHIVEGVMSLTEATQVLKLMISKCKALSKFAPPAFELSKAYLKTLDEKEE